MTTKNLCFTMMLALGTLACGPASYPGLGSGESSAEGDGSSGEPPGDSDDPQRSPSESSGSSGALDSGGSGDWDLADTDCAEGSSESGSDSTGEPDCEYLAAGCFCDGERTEPMADPLACWCGDVEIPYEICAVE